MFDESKELKILNLFYKLINKNEFLISNRKEFLFFTKYIKYTYTL